MNLNSSMMHKNYVSYDSQSKSIDEVKMTQVISNLVENSIKYNVEDGWVHVSLNADYQYFYIRVEDSLSISLTISCMNS